MISKGDIEKLFRHTLWTFSEVTALEVVARVKNTHMPVRATSEPSVMNTLTFLLRITVEERATGHKRQKKLNNEMPDKTGKMCDMGLK